MQDAISTNNAQLHRHWTVAAINACFKTGEANFVCPVCVPEPQLAASNGTSNVRG